MTDDTLCDVKFSQIEGNVVSPTGFQYPHIHAQSVKWYLSLTIIIIIMIII